MKFKELNDNLFKVLSAITDNNDLCKLIHYNTDDPLNQPNIDGNSLLFKKIFPYNFNVEILSEASSILNVSFTSFESGRNNIAYKNGIITFTVLCHHELHKMNEGLRPFFIAHEIDKLFNDQRVIGIGTMQFDRYREIWASKDYSGCQLSYKIVEFN